jgi:hypothetical protein
VWLDVVGSPPGSEYRTRATIQAWARTVLDKNDGVMAELRVRAYGDGGLKNWGALYGDAQHRGVLDAWRDLAEYDSAAAWSARCDATSHDTSAGANARRMVWRRTGVSRVTPRMFADQAELDVVWGEWTQWMQLQAMALDLVIEASHVPMGAATSSDDKDIVAESRPTVDIVRDAKKIDDNLQHQLQRYAPLLQGGNTTYQYLVHVAANLVWALWAPGDSPNAASDGIDVAGWRLPTPAELTFLVLQLGADAPHDTTWDTPVRRRPHEEDQQYVVPGAEGMVRMARDITSRSTDESERIAYEREVRVEYPRQWTSSDARLNQDYFWPRRDVTDALWRRGAGFLAPDAKVLSFEVGHGATPGVDACGVYRSDLHWIVQAGVAFPPPVAHNRPLFRMMVRRYDTRARHERPSPPPPLNATTATAYRSGDVLVESDGKTRWLLGLNDDGGGGFRSLLLTQSIEFYHPLEPAAPATADQLADIAIGAPIYYGSYYDSRRFAGEIRESARQKLREGDVVQQPGVGIWKLYGGRRHWLSTWEAYLDLGQGYRQVPADAMLRYWPIGYPFAMRDLPPSVRGVVRTGDVVTTGHAIFYIQGGTKHWFDGVTYARAGHPPSRRITSEQLDAIPNGPPV